MKPLVRTTTKIQPKTNVPPLVLLTTGQIAAALNVPIHRVQYLLKTRPYIQPLCTVGAYRVYSRSALDTIRRELGLGEEPAPAKVYSGGWVQGEAT